VLVTHDYLNFSTRCLELYKFAQKIVIIQISKIEYPVKKSITIILPQSLVVLYILQKDNFDLGLFPMVSDCSFSAFRLPTLRLNHMMFCLQSHQFIVQHKSFKNGHT